MAYEFDFEKTKNQLANQALRQSSPIGAGDTTQSVKPDSTSIIDSLGASVKGLFKNPLIAQWLIGMGSGMAGAPTMGIGLGNGLKTAGVAASNELTRQATAEDELKQEQQKLQALSAERMAERQYDAQLKAKEAAAEREALDATISSMHDRIQPELAKKTPEQQAYVMAALESYDPKLAVEAIGKTFGPKAASEMAKRYGEIKSRQENGRTYFYQQNVDDPTDIKPVGSPTMDQVTGGAPEIIMESDGSQTYGYRDSNNMFHKISNTTAPQNLSEGTQKTVEGLAQGAAQSQRLLETYRPEFSGKDMVDRALGVLDGKLKWSEISGSDQGAVLWWKDYQSQVNAVRNDLFGASLTPSEKAEFEKTVITRSTDPKLVQGYLEKQNNILSQAIARKNKMIQGGNYQQGQKEATQEMLVGKSKFMDGEVKTAPNGMKYKRIGGRWIAI